MKKQKKGKKIEKDLKIESEKERGTEEEGIRGCSKIEKGKKKVRKKIRREREGGGKKKLERKRVKGRKEKVAKKEGGEKSEKGRKRGRERERQ